MARSLTIRNAVVWNGRAFERRDFYMANGRITDKAARNAVTIDLSGYQVSPGLINAHDHLELNHFPRTKFRERYDNAHQWGEDVNARLDDEPFKTLRSYPLEDRLFIGGLKNLLCGATTVIHHNPPHKALFRGDFPVRVLTRYGWAHSLHFNTDEEVVASYRATPPEVPWFIHLAEGTDKIAAGEYGRLKELGCVGKNTVIVHGVGMTDEDIADAAPRIRALVWCPTTNAYLLGETANVGAWIASGGRVLVGSDSRLTAEGDLLDERRAAQDALRQHDVDESLIDWQGDSLGLSADLALGSRAGWLVADGTTPLNRASIRLIVRGGAPQIGDPHLTARFPGVKTIPTLLDGAPKAIQIDLARRIAHCTLQEPGLELLDSPTPKRRWF